MIAVSSLFAGNTAPTAADFAGNVDATDSLFQTAPTGTLTGSGDLVGVDPLLDPNGPQDHGGATETIALQAGSPAIGHGSNASGLLADQRGYGLPAGTALDIGAYQSQAVPDTGPPAVALEASDVTSATAASPSPYTFSLTITDSVAVSLASLTGLVVTVSPPGGVATLTTTLVSTTPRVRPTPSATRPSSSSPISSRRQAATGTPPRRGRIP